MTKFPYVENLTSNSWNAVANQFKIKIDGVEYFQSYESLIFAIDRLNGKITIDPTYFCYSKTTSKYQSWFLSDDMLQEIKKRFKKDNLETFEYDNWTIEFTDINTLPY